MDRNKYAQFNFMLCSKCGSGNWKSLYYIKNNRVCGECASGIFHRRWIRLKTRYTKINKELKNIKENFKAPIEI